jgi:hypothetical protein
MTTGFMCWALVSVRRCVRPAILRPPGMLVVFLNEWLTASDATAAIVELERVGRGLDARLVTPEGAEVPLTYAFSGNWGTDRNGVSHFYRNAIYFRTPAGTLAPGPESLARYRVELY